MSEQSLQSRYQETIAEIQAKKPVLETLVKHSQKIDQFIGELYQKATTPKDRFCIIALGGYGREEMSLYSDVDLLFLHESDSPEDLQPVVEKILYPLWDAQIDLGYSVRTLKECASDMRQDQTLFTSFLEKRFLIGDESLFQKFDDLLKKEVQNLEFQMQFHKNKVQEQRQRLSKFGSTVYLLEPNIKESEGGLRDIHLIRWLAKVFQIDDGLEGLCKQGYITKAERDRLLEALTFFLKVRNLLHLMQKKKKDQLTFALQVEIAKTLEYKDSTDHLAVEIFMQDYYSLASDVHHLTKILLKKIPFKNDLSHLKKNSKTISIDENFEVIGNSLFLKSKHLFQKKPQALMQTFLHLQNKSLILHYETLDAITQNLDLVNEDFRNDSEIAELFKNVVCQFQNLGKTFFAMHEAKFFDAYIPEFRHLRNRVQHDLYHVYTVDTHSIFALNELAKLHEGAYDSEFPEFKAALQNIKRPDVLSLGLLFHDIGKGMGGNHSVKGAEQARKIAQRLNYSENDQDDIEFLVLAHLLLSHISQRRDLEDPHLIQELALTLKNQERLDMLFVLTWADIRAVSKEAWTEWKGTLLTTLYHKTKNELTSSNTAAQIDKRLQTSKFKILSFLENKYAKPDIENFLEDITPRYLLAHKDKEIAEHFELIQHHKQDGFFVVETPASENHFTELLVFTYHNPRVLSLITGVMLTLGINILALDVFSLSEGFNLIKINLQSVDQKRLNSRVLKKLKNLLAEVFSGETNVRTLLQKQKKPAFMEQKPIQKIESRVVVDNDVSPYYTVIDVYTHDRLGLLYDIVRALADEGCYVEVSKISTKVDQVVDSFYVKDIFGHKIAAKNRLNEIQNTLLKICESSA